MRVLEGLKTYIGIFTIVVAFILEKLGYVVDTPTLTTFLTNSINDIAVFVGAALAAWGRFDVYRRGLAKK